MAQEVGLEHRLEVRLGQSGFAGVTGTIYSVERNGKWSVSTFVNNDQRGPKATGTLGPDALKALAGLLSQDLASDAEAASEVNPVLIEVRYGDQMWTVALPAGTEITGCTTRSEAGCEVRDVAAWLRTELDETQ